MQWKERVSSSLRIVGDQPARSLKVEMFWLQNLRKASLDPQLCECESGASQETEESNHATNTQTDKHTHPGWFY